MLIHKLASLAMSSEQELDFLARSTQMLAEELGVEAVNYLRTGDPPVKKNFSAYPGWIIPIESAEKGSLSAWQIFGAQDSQRSDPKLTADMALAGSILELGLERLLFKQQTIVDGLTQLYNRRHFDRTLEHEMERTRRYGTPFSLLLMDVDRFKTFNDTYGHIIGDEVLKVVAQVLRENTRSSDLAFRYGGEEFAVLLPHTHQHKAERVAGRLKMHTDATVQAAERLREKIHAHPMSHAGMDIPISVSVGAAVYAGTEPELIPAELIRRADDALYRAKEMGRNRSEVVGKNERISILIVDDDQGFCSLLVDYFEKRDYDVSSTTSGKIAVELLNHNTFHLVILDLVMPGLSGTQILERMNKPSKHKKIVAVSALRDEAVKKLCFDYGVCEYLEKPVSVEYLDKNLMARILEMKA